MGCEEAFHFWPLELNWELLWLEGKLEGEGYREGTVEERDLDEGMGCCGRD